MAGGIGLLDADVTMAAAIRGLPDVPGSPDPSDVVHIAALVGQVLERGDLDRFVTDLVESRGIDSAGVSEWLSRRTDSVLVEAFESGVRAPTPRDLSGFLGWDGRRVPVGVLETAAGMVPSDPDAVSGSLDVEAAVNLAGIVPGAVVACRNRIEATVVGLGLALTGRDPSRAVVPDDWGSIGTVVAVESPGPPGDLSGSPAMLAGEAVVVVPSRTLGLRALSGDRRELVETGRLVSAVELSRDFGAVDVRRDGGRSEVYLARFWGSGARGFTGDVAETVRNRTTVDRVGAVVPTSKVSESFKWSLSPTQYVDLAPAPRVRIGSIDIGMAVDDYRRALEAERDAGLRVADAAERVLAVIGGRDVP